MFSIKQILLEMSVEARAEVRKLLDSIEAAESAIFDEIKADDPEVNEIKADELEVIEDKAEEDTAVKTDTAE